MKSVAGLFLEKEIGRGAFGQVFQGTRNGANNGDKFAIKVLPEGVSAVEKFRVRFFREAASVALISHPAIVRIFDVGQENGRLYLVMEYVEGETLGTTIARGAVDEKTLIRWGKEAAEALHEVHVHGLVHRDIKPENVIIDHQGSVKLIDFGFAVQAERDEAISGQGGVGTLFYSAPEQLGLTRRAVDGRADLDALGAVLYECVTGRPPFQSNDAAELLQAHASLAPEDPTRINPNLSPALAKIILKLLAKDPDDRYQTGRGLAHDFASLDEATESWTPGQNDSEPVKGARVPWVGRQEEKQRALGVLTKSIGGKGGILLIEGAPGSGKSRLIREVVEQTRQQGLPVLRTKCELADNAPLSAMREVFEALRTWIQKRRPVDRAPALAKVRGAAGEYAEVLGTFFPSFRNLLSLDESQGSVFTQELLYHATAEFYARLANEFSGLVLLIDDVQWIDDASRKILALTSRSIGKHAFMVAASARDDSESRAGLNKFVEETDPESLSRIALSPLDDGTVELLVRAHLGSRAVDPELTEQVVRRSDGNPFAVGEYLQAMIENGLIFPSWDGWRIDRHGLESLQLSADVVHLIIQRMERLQAESRDFITLAAVIGARFEVAMLESVAKADRFRIEAAIAEAIESRLLEAEDRETYRFIHDRVQEAFLQTLLPEERTDAHDRIAAHFEEMIECFPSASTFDRKLIFAWAHHASLGAPEKNRERAYQANLRAGVQAVNDYSNEDAIRYLKEASRWRAADAPLDPIYDESMAEGYARTARVEEALRHFDRFLRSERDPLKRARIRSRKSMVYASSFRNEEALVEVRHGLAELGASIPSLKILFVFSSLFYWALGFVASSLKWGFGGVQGRKRQIYRERTLLYAVAASHSFNSGHVFDTLLFGIRPYWNAHRLGKCRESAEFLVAYALLMTMFGLVRKGDELVDQAVEMAEQLGDRTLIAHCQFFHAEARQLSGRTLEAEKLYSEDIIRNRRWADLKDYLSEVAALEVDFVYRGLSSRIEYWYTKGVERSSEAGDAAKFIEAHPFRIPMIYHHIYRGLWTEASEALDRSKAFAQSVPNDMLVWSILLGAEILFLVEQGDLGDRLENAIREFDRFHLKPEMSNIFMNMYYVAIAQARLAQVEQARAAGKSPDLKPLRDAVGVLKRVSLVPVIKAHYHWMQGELARLEGKAMESWKAFDLAERLAAEHDSPWALLGVNAGRARLEQGAQRARSARGYADEAIAIARNLGWGPTEKRLRQEFSALEPHPGLETSAGGSSSSWSRRSGSLERSSPASASGGGAVAVRPDSVRSQRQAEALLQLSLSASHALDPDQTAKGALDEIIRILGAERAILFLAEEGMPSLKVRAARGAGVGDLSDLSGYSGTVVELVRQKREPFILNGVEEGEGIGSKSIALNELRSIIAAPLMMGSKLLGVIYLDNRLIKGLFSHEDVNVLNALANHIAVAFETARSAKLEVEKRMLEKDMELTGAVQSLYLPAQDVFENDHFKLAGLYRPTLRCGGDWWWYDTDKRGRTLIMLGDVTGHGPGPAMVTASIASTYRMMRGKFDFDSSDQVDQVIEQLNGMMTEVSRESYLMSFAVLMLDPVAGKASFWSAGGMPVYRFGKDGEVSILHAPGAPLGSPMPSVGVASCDIKRGDRFMLYTDGLTDLLLPEGKRLGARALRKLVLERAGQSPIEAKAEMFKEIDALRDGTPLEDDLTFVLVEVVSEAIEEKSDLAKKAA